MAMRWRASATSRMPAHTETVDRRGARIIDQEEGRRRLSAYELNAQIGSRGCLLFINDLTKDIERQARHVGVWGRWKAAIKQLINMQEKMLEKVSIEQIVSISNNTKNMKLSMSPELLPGDPEQIILPMKEHNRLLCAALSYCEMHCDGSSACQHNCKIKKLLDNSCYME